MKMASDWSQMRIKSIFDYNKKLIGGLHLFIYFICLSVSSNYTLPFLTQWKAQVGLQYSIKIKQNKDTVMKTSKLSKQL